MSFFPDIDRWEYVVLDTEDSGLQFWKDKLFGVSITAPDDTSFYYDLRVEPQARKWLIDKIPKCKLIVCHHAKFDQHFSREAGIIFPEGKVFCTMIAAAVINEHEFEYSLEHLAEKYTNVRKRVEIYQDLAKLFGGKPTATAQAPNFVRAPVALMSEYGKDDGIATNHLYKDYCLPEIEKQGLQQVITLEMELLPAIVRMEQRGVRVDIDKAATALVEIDKQEKQVRRDLNKMAGFEVNPNPSNSLKELLRPALDENGVWTLMDGTVCEKTDAGAASIDSDCLRDMKHPAGALILRARKLNRLGGVFLKGHILGHHDNGVIHANINQTKSDNNKGTGTGRLSINDPALQQIHKRDKEIASVIRAMFIPEGGHDWVCNDWAQMDFRVFAHYVKNQKILDMYAKNPDTDFHQLCSDITGIPRSPRFAGDANAKQINLGLVFGMGPGKLASEMGLPYTTETYTKRDGSKKQFLKPGAQAEEIFEIYHRGIPGVKGMLENATAVAKSRGYVKTIMGRHIRFPRGMFTHKAGGLIFQGSAADSLKVKIIQVDRYFEEAKGEKGYLCLNVHDEFDSNVPRGRTDVHADISRIVTDFYSDGQPIKFRVPIKTEQGVGPNWWEACKD